MSRTYRAVQYGCGPIGSRVVQYGSERKNIEFVGAVDIDPAKVGKDLGDVAEAGRKLGVAVTSDADELLSSAKPDIVIHTTGSKFDRVYEQLAAIVSAGVNVVSTCEELSFPYRKHPELSQKLDRLARENGATVLATGVNPGFLMDTWPLVMTAVCKDVTKVAVARIQDASSRRIPFQQKIGAGLTKEEFQRKVDSGDFGHVGLPESIGMLAEGLGWQVDDIKETIEPVVAEREVSSNYMSVEKGKAAGIKQVAYGYADGEPRISMEFQAYIGAPESYDSVSITGTPDMNVKVEGGTQGDIATVSIVLNAVPRVVAAAPGLLTMKDLPVVMWAGG